MNRPGQQVELLEVASGNSVVAMLFEGLTPANIDFHEKRWRPVLEEARKKAAEWRAKGVQVIGPEDAHWDWKAKFDRSQRKPLVYRDYAIEYAGSTEGMMQLNLATQRSRIEQGKPLVYVEFVQTAPWNRPTIVRQPRFRRVGTLLIMEAVGVSTLEGFGGRIGLHALPSAVDFYRKMSMRSFGQDASHQNLEYFELSGQDAVNFLAHI